MEKLYIIGAGPGSVDLLTESAKATLKSARRVLNTRETPLRELLAELNVAGKGATAALVSGDSGFYSIAKKIINEYSHLYDIEVLPGISSIQYFCAKIKTTYDDAVIVSLHGRDVNIVAKAAYNKKVFALTGAGSQIKPRTDNSAQLDASSSMHLNVSNPAQSGASNLAKLSASSPVQSGAGSQAQPFTAALTTGGNGRSVRDICRELCAHGLGGVTVSVGERLSFPDERIIKGKAFELLDMEFNALSVVLIENPAAVNPHAPLCDGDFIRGGPPMTKEETRWLSIQKLGITPGDVVYDVGAGTGSVAIEMARKAFEGFVYAVEVNEAACALIRENAAKHGAFNMEMVCGLAPDVFERLPPPDKAFIGGSSGKMDEILGKLVELNPCVKIVANAVTLQTLNQVMACMAKHGFADTGVICQNIAKSVKAGGYDLMTAQNPVYVISGTGGGAS